MTTTSHKINDKLFLIKQSVEAKTAAKATPKPTNHIFTVDCSGSMYGELPKLREQAKKKLTTSLKEGDSVSIIWFSGKGEYGTILEGETVDTLKDLQRVHSTIDRWFRVVGLTGFKEPLALAGETAARLKQKFPNNANVLTFMSDGCDNQWPRNEIISTMDKAAGGFDAVTLVEYGYYVDRPLLTSLAEKAGGSLIFAQDFDRYEAVITDVMARRVVGGKKIDVALPNADIIGRFAFSLADGDLLTYATDSNQVQVAESTKDVFFLSPTAVGTPGEDIGLLAQAKSPTPPAEFAAAYAAASLFAVRMKPEVVFPVLAALGDVTFIESFANCFGKQAYSAFMDAAKTAAFDQAKRYAKGYNPKLVPREDAYTVLELLGSLQEDEGCRLLLNDPRFVYNKTSRGRLDSNTVLTDEEQAQVETLQRSMAGVKDVKKLKEIQAQIDTIVDKPEALKFVEDETSKNAGYEVRDLTWSQERPNVSVLVRKTGTVDLSSRKDLPSGVPATFQTNTFRNYNIVTDGLVNVAVLPTRISSDLTKTLKAEISSGRLSDEAVSFEGDITVFNMDKIPVLNRQQVKAVSAKDLFTREYKLCKAEGAQKVFNTLAKEKLTVAATSKGLSETYGEATATWLKEQGLTDNGFSPKMVQAPSTDFYMGKTLDVKLAGLSSLPSVNDVRKKLTAKKQGGALTISQQCIAPTLQAAEAHLASNVITAAADPAAALKTYIETEKKAKTTECRKLRRDLAQTKFAVIVGQTWFTEFKSLDENAMDIVEDGHTISCTATPKEIEIKI